MKKLTLLLLTFFAVALTANVFAQDVKVNGVWKAITPPIWNQFKNPHVVTKGSTYEYAVEEHSTLNLAGLRNKLATLPIGPGNENLNRYTWELLKVNIVDPTAAILQYKDEVSEVVLGSFKTFTKHLNTYKWDGKTTGDYYLIRVKEYANHDLYVKLDPVSGVKISGNASSEVADEASMKVSEILVKIGDEAVIVIPTGPDSKTLNKDGYLCNKAGIVAKDFDDLTSFSATTFICNAAPLISVPVDPTKPAGAKTLDGFSVVLSVEKISMSTANGGNFKQEITIDVPTSALTNLVDLKDPTDPTKTLDLGIKDPSGYYALQIPLVTIATALDTKDTGAPKTKIFDFDAKDFDIYYEITVKGYIHKDTDIASATVTTEGRAYTVTTPSADLLVNSKLTRVCGVYTQPKITRIQFKK